MRPIALNMVSAISTDAECQGLPISGIGGISTWRDAAAIILLGSTNVQVCTAAMHYGFRIVEEATDGLSNWMDEKGFETLDDFRGLMSPEYIALGKFESKLSYDGKDWITINV